MGIDLKDALRKFVEEEVVEGRVYKEGQDLGVNLVYRHREGEPEFEIQRGSDVPAHIRFRNQLIEARAADDEWETIDGEDLQVFMMLDPRVFYPIAERAERRQDGTFALTYRLADLGLGISQKFEHLPSSRDELLQYLEAMCSSLSEEERIAVQKVTGPWFMVVAQPREAEFRLADDGLAEMVLRELPPYDRSYLAVEFIYPL